MHWQSIAMECKENKINNLINVSTWVKNAYFVEINHTSAVWTKLKIICLCCKQKTVTVIKIL